MRVANYESFTTFGTPSGALRPRADASTQTAYPTASNGCVECPASNGSCPLCPDGQECTLTSQTCTSCPQYRCVKISTSKSISAPQIGGIVGGVVGGVAVLALAGVFYYLLVYRKKHPRTSNDLDGHDSKYEMEMQGGTSNINSSGGGARSVAGDADTKNRRLSSYESFMRPPGYNKRGAAKEARPRVTSATYTADDESKRYSVATTMSTTNALNILPIAYIPGVTIRPTKNNTRLIFLYDNESVFSDFTGLDAALIQERGDAQRGTVTAVRSQPRLVNVARIEEEDENAEEAEEIVLPVTHVDANLNPGVDSDADSDVDSDIGEINRATSTRQNHAPASRGVFDDNAYQNSYHDTDVDTDLDTDGGHTTGQASRLEGFESLGEIDSHTLEFTLEDSDGDGSEDDDDDDDEKSFVLDIARET